MHGNKALTLAVEITVTSTGDSPIIVVGVEDVTEVEDADVAVGSNNIRTNHNFRANMILNIKHPHAAHVMKNRVADADVQTTAHIIYLHNNSTN